MAMHVQISFVDAFEKRECALCSMHVPDLFTTYYICLRLRLAIH